jgi:hypothetical protein
VGYNTNVRHKGNLYHIQTEDSGVKRPHVITQLFADGGRIIASEKTSYEEHVGAENIAVIVKQLMQDQHKRVFIGLRLPRRSPRKYSITPPRAWSRDRHATSKFALPAAPANGSHRRQRFRSGTMC